MTDEDKQLRHDRLIARMQQSIDGNVRALAGLRAAQAARAERGVRTRFARLIARTFGQTR